MLSVNLCVQFGLFNGALGHDVDIVYKNGRNPSYGLPDVVMVIFLNYSGPPFIHGTVVPLFPATRQVERLCHKCKRTQIPLKLGWATTIHKCQGMTKGSGEINQHIIIKPGTRQFESRNPVALFVPLSRAKSTGTKNAKLPEFAWHQSIFINQDRLCHVVKTKTTDSRTQEIMRLQNIANKTKRSLIFFFPIMNIVISLCIPCNLLHLNSKIHSGLIGHLVCNG